MKEILSIICLLFFSCERQKEATGFYDTIHVFGDETLFQTMKASLNESVGLPTSLPAYEQRYVLRYHRFDDFDRYKQSKNLLFLIALDRKTVLNGVPERLLGSNAKAALKRNEINFFMAKNAYAKNQALLLFIATKADEASAVFTDQFYRVSTFKSFNDYNLERIQKQLYHYQENTASNEAIEKQHGYYLRHPNGYTVVDNNLNADSNLISYFASNPTRWLWIRYFDQVQKSDFTVEKLFDLRDHTMSTFFDGDSVDRLNEFYVDSAFQDDLFFKRIQSSYKSYDEDKMPIGGGPFISYCFLDTKSKRLYIADGHLFYPGKRKSLKLMELEAILKTFRKSKKMEK